MIISVHGALPSHPVFPNPESQEKRRKKDRRKDRGKDGRKSLGVLPKQSCLSERAPSIDYDSPDMKTSLSKERGHEERHSRVAAIAQQKQPPRLEFALMREERLRPPPLYPFTSHSSLLHLQNKLWENNPVILTLFINVSKLSCGPEEGLAGTFQITEEIKEHVYSHGTKPEHRGLPGPWGWGCGFEMHAHTHTSYLPPPIPVVPPHLTGVCA